MSQTGGKRPGAPRKGLWVFCCRKWRVWWNFKESSGMIRFIFRFLNNCREGTIKTRHLLVQHGREQ